MANAPTPGDGFVDGAPEGEKKMANAGDLSDDSLELLLTEQMSSFDALQHEAAANAQSSHSIVRHSGARKFNQEDPIEAAAAEMILKK